MRKWIIACCLTLAASLPLAAQRAGETPEQKAERMEWFDRAKLGIFIHWGIYAVDGVSESWSFYNNYLPYDQYMAQKDRFTAAQYKPAEWARLIKESGAQYTVITSKHHDGVALWDTKASDLSIPKQTPAGKDVLSPFVKEIRKQGLRLGLYYSLLDWSHPDYPNFTKTATRYAITDDPARWQRFIDFDKAQLKELSKAYKPDLFWFDGDWEQTAETWHAPEIIDLLTSYNKDVIVNSRIQGYGDYGTPEQGVPTIRPEDRWWELCYTINDSWGFQHTDLNFKTPQMVLKTFVDCLSMGGNLLLDIGPREDGTIPEEEVAVLKELGRWTRKHKEAVYQTRAGIPAGHVPAYTTLNEGGDILYVYLPYKPVGPVEIKGLMNRVNRVWVVGSGQMLHYKVYNKVYWNEVPGLLEIDVPEEVLDPAITVLAILLDGPAKLYHGPGQVITAN